MRSGLKFSLDTRNDLGYGKTKDSFHRPRKRAGTFPYTETPEELDAEEDLESQIAVSKKNPDRYYQKLDPGDAASTDHFYFAAGNTKLSDCFSRIDDVLVEVDAAHNSMSSVPGLHRGKMTGIGTQGGHSLYITNQPPRKTGGLEGWSKAPPPFEDDSNEDQLLTLQDLIDAMISEE